VSGTNGTGRINMRSATRRCGYFGAVGPPNSLAIAWGRCPQPPEIYRFGPGAWFRRRITVVSRTSICCAYHVNSPPRLFPWTALLLDIQILADGFRGNNDATMGALNIFPRRTSVPGRSLGTYVANSFTPCIKARCAPRPIFSAILINIVVGTIVRDHPALRLGLCGPPPFHMCSDCVPQFHRTQAFQEAP
jgi:hypothetical protein